MVVNNKSVEHFVYQPEALVSPRTDKQYSTPSMVTMQTAWCAKQGDECICLSLFF